MSRRLLARVVIVSWAFAWASPAAAQSRREMQMMADIRMLQEQTQQMQQQLVAAITQIGDSLKLLSARLDEQTGMTRKALADQKLVIDQFGSDLRIVRERVDETNVRITSLSQEVEALRLAIPQYSLPAALPSPDPVAVPTPQDSTPDAVPSTLPAQPAPVPPQAAAPVAPGISPQRLYDTAWSDFTAGQWTLCIEGFNTYLRTFPRSDAADDAQYYVGECQYSDGKFAEAMDAFNRVIANFPKGDRVPDAYYKRGLVFDRTAQADRARESWETLVKLFPDSDLARLAKQNLDRLNRGRPPGRDDQ